MTLLTGRRIAIATRIFEPEPGAASLRLSALVRSLADAGASVTVYTAQQPRGYAAVRPDIAERARIRRMPVLRDRGGYIRGYFQYLSFDVPLFFRLLFGPRYDCVISEPPPTTGTVVRIACDIRSTPFIYYAADIWSEAAAVAGTLPLVTRAVRGMESFVATGASAVAAVSESVARRVAEIAPRAKVSTIGNGYDDDVFTLEGSAHESRSPYLLYAGTASEVHGAMIFIDALPAVQRAVPHAQVIFIGQGSEWDAMKARADEVAPGVATFLPRMTASETARWIRGAAATIASVLPDGYEAFPTKMLASAGCGTPVVYTGPEPGYAFANSTDVGWAVEYDVGPVSGAMITALRSTRTPDDRRRLSAWAREHHSLAAVMVRMRALIATVVRPRR